MLYKFILTLNMKGSFSYIAFAILIWSCLSASSSSISTWITYENNSSYKWCRYYATTTSGYACASSDTSRTWGGNSLSEGFKNIEKLS